MEDLGRREFAQDLSPYTPKPHQPLDPESERKLADADSADSCASEDGSGQNSLSIDRGRTEANLAQLVRTIEGEIIPRLLLAHRGTGRTRTTKPDIIVPTPEDVVELTRLVLNHDVSVALAFVTALRGRGVKLESIFLGLLAPAARYLGDLWVEDICDFTDVTVGLMRLNQVLRQLSCRSNVELSARDDLRRALLVPGPNEQHSFGLVMVAEFFRRAGWTVREEPSCTGAQVADIVAAEYFDIVGFSVSCDKHLDVLSATLRSARRSSRNHAIGFMVGGRVFLDKPDLVSYVGAHATAADGKLAVSQAQTLVALLGGKDN